MGIIVDTEKKYRLKTLDDFVFPNEEVEELARAYGTGEVTRPLILSGPNGTGKSVLAELIPRRIEGDRHTYINRVRSCDLNSNKEVYGQFTRNKQFDDLFTVNDQQFNYNVIEEVNFEAKASDAFRTVLDDYRGTDLTIMTTNRLSKVDVGVRSRCEVLEVPPCEPHVFLPRAMEIIKSEGYDIETDVLLEALQSVYDVASDNRRYYQKIDELLRKAR